MKTWKQKIAEEIQLRIMGVDNYEGADIEGICDHFYKEATDVMQGVSIISTERWRQQDQEGWTPEHDDTYTHGELAMAGASYAMSQYYRFATSGNPPWSWPWFASEWKPSPDDRIRELAKAGALIAAEIDRLLRLKQGAK